MLDLIALTLGSSSLKEQKKIIETLANNLPREHQQLSKK